MSIIKKCDVKVYLATRRRGAKRQVRSARSTAPAVEPMTGGAVNTVCEQVFAADFSLEHSSPGGSLTAVVVIAAGSDSQGPAAPGKADARSR